MDCCAVSGREGAEPGDGDGLAACGRFGDYREHGADRGEAAATESEASAATREARSDLFMTSPRCGWPVPGRGRAAAARVAGLWLGAEREAALYGIAMPRFHEGPPGAPGKRAMLSSGPDRWVRRRAGLRHDGGDAETGTGVELGGRLSYTRLGVTVEGAARAPVAHEASGYKEWGASGAVRIDPGASGRWLSFTLKPASDNAVSAAERLWGLGDARGVAPETEFDAPGQQVLSIDADLQVDEARGERARHAVEQAAIALAVAAGDERRALEERVFADLAFERELEKRRLYHRYAGRQLFEVDEPEADVVGRQQKHRGRHCVWSAASQPGDAAESHGVEQKRPDLDILAAAVRGGLLRDHRFGGARGTPDHRRLTDLDEEDEGRGELARAERVVRRERRLVERRIRAAKFPTVKSLDSFEFKAIPSVNKVQVLEHEIRLHSSLEHRPPALETIVMPSWPPGSVNRPAWLAKKPSMH